MPPKPRASARPLAHSVSPGIVHISDDKLRGGSWVDDRALCGARPNDRNFVAQNAAALQRHQDTFKDTPCAACLLLSLASNTP